MYFLHAAMRKYYRNGIVKIRQDDGLPQQVCIKCIGALEFVCDFYEMCHHTQETHVPTSQIIASATSRERSDIEANKENISPTIDLKRGIKAPSESSNILKSQLSRSNVSYKTNEKEDDAFSYVDTDSDQIKMHSGVENSSVLSENQVVSQPLSLESNQEIDWKLAEEQHNLQKTVTIETKPKKVKRKIGVLTEDNSVQTRNSFRFKKIKLERSNENECQSPSEIIRKKQQEKDRENKNNDGSYSKQCYLRATCTKNNPEVLNIDDTTSINRNLTNAREKIIDVNSKWMQLDHQKKNEEFRTTVTDRIDKETQDSTMRYSSETSTAMIVKEERMEQCEDRIYSNHFVWIPNPELMPEAGKPKTQKDSDLLDISPAVGDEAELSQIDLSDPISNNIDSNQPSSVTAVFTDEGREATISSINTLVIERVSEELRPELETGKDSTALTFHLPPSISKQLNHTSNKDLKRDKNNPFGKVSDLISEQDKNIIETYYNVNMSVVNKEEVERNMTYSDKKNIKCSICNANYGRSDKCQVHIWGHLNMKPYQCKACNFSTVTVSNMRCHIRKSHLKIKPFACRLCEKRYVTAMLLKEHLNTHTGARPFKCKICNFACTNRQMLSYHNTTHKPHKDISCKICGNMFYSKFRLRAHMLVHNKDKVVMCNLCSSYLSSAKALELHQQNIHARDYVCNTCGKTMKSRKALHNHQNVHSAAKYKCSKCSNVYKSKHILMEHLLKHEGIRKYKCKSCEKSFAQQSHLAAHMAVHSEVRFHCPGCKKPFNRHDNMKIHTKRCEQFLSRPELRNSIARREHSKSMNKTKSASDVANLPIKENSCNKINAHTIIAGNNELVQVKPQDS